MKKRCEGYAIPGVDSCLEDGMFRRLPFEQGCNSAVLQIVFQWVHRGWKMDLLFSEGYFEAKDVGRKERKKSTCHAAGENV